MVLTILLIIIGLAAMAAALNNKSGWLAPLGALGWLALIVGTLRLTVPDFFNF